MEQIVNVRRAGAHRFEPLDAPVERLTPKQLLLLSLGRCAGLTAEALLEKMRIPYEEFAIEISGVLTDPAERADSVYTSMRQVFRLDGCPAGEAPRAAHALSLTAGKYCGVGLMFERFCPVATELFVNGEAFPLRVEV